MLSDPDQEELPLPAAAVVDELKQSGQKAKIVAMNSSVHVECVAAHFTSPMEEFLPRESKQCRFSVLKPPKGVNCRQLSRKGTFCAE
jgi:hypothetical protein